MPTALRVRSLFAPQLFMSLLRSFRFLSPIPYKTGFRFQGSDFSKAPQLLMWSLVLFFFYHLCPSPHSLCFAQMETATLNGVIQDPNGAVVPDVEVTATRIETGTAVTTKTNGAGIYVFTNLMPGHYHLQISRPGFKAIAIKEFELHVQDKLEQNFSLEIGSVSELVTVNGDSLGINTTYPAGSTMIDRN